MKCVPQKWTWGADSDGSRHPVQICGQPAVWLARLGGDPKRDARLFTFLSPDERLRCANLKQPDDRERFVLGRGMVRLWLGTHLNLPAERVAFDYGPFGKPRLAAAHRRPELRFNVSHSGSCVAVAFSPTHEIGIDLEQERPETEWAEIASSLFAPDECRTWQRLPPAERSVIFFQAWTKREAILKALGVGLAQQVAPSDSRELEICELDLPAGYFGALAWRTDGTAKKPPGLLRAALLNFG